MAAPPSSLAQALVTCSTLARRKWPGPQAAMEAIPPDPVTKLLKRVVQLWFAGTITGLGVSALQDFPIDFISRPRRGPIAGFSTSQGAN